MTMIRRAAILLLAMLLSGSALAEVYEGVTCAASSVFVSADTSGLLKRADVQVGSRVEEGQVLCTLQGERIFSAVDGSVSILHAQVGDEISGTAIELMPIERFVIHCTVEKAYQNSETTLIHSGETVYVKCTADGSHRAIGVVTAVDGSEYRVLTLGGELYPGEAVYLYRDESFSARQRVGIGTVVVNDTFACEGSGTLTALNVSEGDTVERGQLLCEVNGGEICAPVSGIVVSLSAREGEQIQKDQVVAEIVPDDRVWVEIQVDESDISAIAPGETALLMPAGVDEDQAFCGVVEGMTWVAEDGCYTVRITPAEDVSLPLGMSVSVRIG
ncbi:MAG: HlyD family efflux transporter periplasmic adaptor subunit [Clostridia bacterium]|nr:HlyD family efflux transporter periplasmic adaptor subunit [Clostridia bacterium]